jgi:hypothetical protein
MQYLVSFIFILCFTQASATTIAIIDTGFDLDHEFLKPRFLKQETDEEAMHPLAFNDNSHLKEPVIKDQSLLQEVFLFRNLRAKKHREGLSLAEFEWFNKKNLDKKFLEQVKRFKKHAHGTFVAGIALREGENISIFPLRGLHIPIPVVAVEDNSGDEITPLKSKTPEEQYSENIINSQNRVITKFTKICRYLSMNNINIVNASYGITYKNITTKFREKYRDFTKKEIDELKLKEVVDGYFKNIMDRTSKIIQKYPKMLFVFSAGNLGLNNDQFPHYPSKIRLPNTLSVGAMNGDYLASFSNYGKTHVDIGAPGVAILSFVPKVYSPDGKNMYSPSSGTSMAAPYISNIAAQILNINPKLKPHELKKIIMETGDEKAHLMSHLVSGAIVNNQQAIKAAQMSREMSLDASIALANSGLIVTENSISIGATHSMGSELLKDSVMDSIPREISPEEIDEIQSTSEESSSPQDLKTNKPGSLIQLPSVAPTAPKLLADPVPSNQNAEQSPLPSEVPPPSSSQASPPLLQTPDLENVPSSP